MTTRKSSTSKSATKLSTNSSPKTRKARSSRGSRGPSDVLGSARRIGEGAFDFAGVDFAKLIGPGAAVLASGALAAAGYLFKDQIGDLFADFLKVAAKNGSKAAHAASKAVDATREESKDIAHGVSHKLSIDSLLGLAGLQKRSTFGTIVGPAVGVAVGFVAGSAMTHFFGRAWIARMTDKHETTDAPKDGLDHAASTSDGANEGVHTNGGLGRGIS